MQHQLIVMWGPPRSLSTAFVRMIAARGDFTILHEPLCDLSACDRHEHVRPDGSIAAVTSPAQLFDYVRALRAGGNVFVKDTCEYPYDALLSGSDYLREARHVFMLRDPAKVINSHYHINPQLTCEEVGYAYLARVYDLVKTHAVQAPLFVDADELAADPETAVAAFCRDAGMAHMSSALNWDRGHLDVWRRTARWHVDAAESTGIKPVAREYATRVDNDERLHGFYLANQVHYAYLQAERVRARTGLA